MLVTNIFLHQEKIGKYRYGMDSEELRSSIRKLRYLSYIAHGLASLPKTCAPFSCNISPDHTDDTAALTAATEIMLALISGISIAQFLFAWNQTATLLLVLDHHQKGHEAALN